jgi:Transposase DDE domain
MKKKTHDILEKLRGLIQNEDFKKAHSVKQQDFSRNCLINFEFLVIFILNLIRRSLQSELNSFSKIIDARPISKQAFSAARKKLQPSVFLELNKHLIAEYYTDNEFQTFYGYRLLVVDGTTLQLPEGDSISEKYGGCSNQKGRNMSMARVSHAFDPFNALTLNAIMSPYAVSEQAMIFDHIRTLLPLNNVKDLYLLDRGYPSITLIFFLIANNKDFVMRSGLGWLSAVKQVLTSGKNDQIIEICPRMLIGDKRKEFQKLLPDVCLKKRIKIRVLIIELCTGEKEILVTSLLGQQEFNHSIFKGLYHLRWDGEENYKFHKVRIEIENFSGKSPLAIEQDFHATVFTANIRALLAEEAQGELEELPQKQLKYDYKINKNISLSILKDEIVKVLFNPTSDLQTFCENLKREMKKSTVPIRPERSLKHKTKYGGRKYHMNARRAL